MIQDVIFAFLCVIKYWPLFSLVSIFGGVIHLGTTTYPYLDGMRKKKQAFNNIRDFIVGFSITFISIVWILIIGLCFFMLLPINFEL